MKLFHVRPRDTASSRRFKVALFGAAVATLALITATAGAAQAGTDNRPRDTTPPSAPTFASTAYPINGPTTVTVGGSGTITLNATDSGKHATGVAAIRYNLNGTSIDSPGITGQLSSGHGTVTVALSSLHFGTNVLWAQAIDRAGNRSAVSNYAFYIQQSAFGPFAPGRGGDLTGDGSPDLATVDAAGDIQLFASPETTTVDPTGDTTNDPRQYGGRVLVPAQSNARWADPDRASASGAFVSHGGSFTGNTVDDLVVVQNGHLGIARSATPTWTFATTNVTKPACTGCANYNDQDWSSVNQLVAVQTTPGSPPNLLTVEIVNDVATLWWYAPVNGSFAFQPPVALSVDTGSWHWGDLQLVGAGPLPGSTGVSLWVRDPGTGTLALLHDIVSGVTDPGASAVVVATGFTAVTFPLITTLGMPDGNGNLPLWASDATGHLVIVPTTTTTTGATTVRAPKTISAAGWADHEIALGSTYPAYNNSGVATPGTPNEAFDTATTNAYAYNADALANATINPDDIVNDGSGGCPTGWTTCGPGLGSTTLVALPNDQGSFDTFNLPGPWAHRRDNVMAAGQLLAVPVPGTSGPAHAIRFLGAAATNDTVNGASVTATVTYTDGHTQIITIAFANWTQDVTASPVAGNTVVATMDRRTVAATGADDPTTNYLFATPAIALLDGGAPLPANVQIASLRLGTNPAVHIFAIALD